MRSPDDSRIGFLLSLATLPLAACPSDDSDVTASSDSTSDDGDDDASCEELTGNGDVCFNEILDVMAECE